MSPLRALLPLLLALAFVAQGRMPVAMAGPMIEICTPAGLILVDPATGETRRAPAGGHDSSCCCLPVAAALPVPAAFPARARQRGCRRAPPRRPLPTARPRALRPRPREPPEPDPVPR